MLASGVFNVPDIPAGQTTRIDLPKSAQGDFKGEIWLTITIQLRQTTSWAEAGHVINICQAQLRSAGSPKSLKSTTDMLNVVEHKSSAVIEGGDFSVEFDKVCGTIRQWTVNGFQVFSQDKPYQPALSFGFWRAPTDNDNAWQSAEWRNWGLDDMKTSILDCQLVQHDEGIVIKCKAHIMPPILAWGFEADVEYKITTDGQIAITSTLHPFGPAPKTLPRVGLDLQLSSSFESTQWFGRGPGESYHDKHLSQPIGIYAASLDRLQTRYDVPQENGNHVDTRWVSIHGAAGNGFRVGYEAGPSEREHFQWALLKYNAEDLEKARHPCDLVSRSGPLLRLDCDNAGLGTAACGPGTNPGCQVECRQRTFSFILSPC